MFDSLLCGKFSKKCKHCVKCINSRLVLIRKKKQATVKFWKKDIADLLANGHDSNAFGRMDALIVEMNHIWCYDMIEHYCQCILNLLPSLQKQRECPEEAMEAISTLIFAAARFSDLPELYDLRRVFQERYGSQMESSVNSEFVEKLQKKSFSTDTKLRLMKNIAEEFSVRWDPRAFQQKLSSPTPPPSDKPKILGSNNERRSHADMNGRNAAVNHPKKPIFDAAVEVNTLLKHDPNSFNNRKETVSNPDIKINGRKEMVNNSVETAIKRNRADLSAIGSLNSRDEKVSTDTSVKMRNGATDKERLETPPRSSLQRQQVYPEPKDIHVIPVVSNGRSHESIGKAQKVYSDNSEQDVEVNAYVKSTWAQNAILKSESTAHSKSEIAQVGPGLSGLVKESNSPVIAREAKAVNMIPPYTILKGARNGGDYVVKAPIYNEFPKFEKEKNSLYDEFPKTEKVSDNKPIYDELPRAEKRFDPSVQESKHTPRPINMIPPPYTKSKYTDIPTNEKPDKDEMTKPVSVRSRIPKSPIDIDNYEIVNDVRKDERRAKMHGTTSSSRKKHEGRSNAPYDGDCDEEEEEVMDRLLAHLSKKGIESSKRRTRAKAPHPERISSLPSEPVSPVFSIGPTRSTSLQPDANGYNMRIPDYDDLAARFNALKRT